MDEKEAAVSGGITGSGDTETRGRSHKTGPESDSGGECLNESAARLQNKRGGPGRRRFNAMSNKWLLSGGKRGGGGGGSSSGPELLVVSPRSSRERRLMSVLFVLGSKSRRSRQPRARSHTRTRRITV